MFSFQMKPQFTNGVVKMTWLLRLLNFHAKYKTVKMMMERINMKNVAAICM